MQKRKLGNSSLEVSALGLGCMGMSFGYGPRRRQAGGDRADPRRRRPRRHLLRHRRGLRPVHERGARRRGARARPRPGRDRHQVRVRHRRAASRRASTAGPSTIRRGRRGVAQAAQDRPHRPALPAPRRSRRADRGRRRHGEGTDPAGQGQALRPVRGRRADDPPRARGPAGHGPAERVLAVVAGAGGGDPADARGARDRVRPVQPARQGLPDREDRREHDVRRAPTSATPSPASIRRTGRPTRRSSSCSAAIAERKSATPAQIALAWLLAQKPWIVPIPGTTKLHRLEENIGAADVELTADDLREIDDRRRRRSRVQGERYPEAPQRMIDR